MMMKYFAFVLVFMALSLCSCHNNKAANEQAQREAGSDSAKYEQTQPEAGADVAQSSDEQTGKAPGAITEEMAFEGVSNYCHKEYDWSVAKDNPDMMYLKMGEESDSAYLVVFRSYTGAFVHFYVNKSSGATRMVEKVPSMNIEEESGTINLFDYLKQ